MQHSTALRVIHVLRTFLSLWQNVWVRQIFKCTVSGGIVRLLPDSFFFWLNWCKQFNSLILVLNGRTWLQFNLAPFHVHFFVGFQDVEHIIDYIKKFIVNVAMWMSEYFFYLQSLNIKVEIPEWELICERIIMWWINFVNY